MDAEDLLQVFEKLQMDFDDEKNLKGMSVVVPPGAQAALQKEFERAEADPKLKARFDELFQRKWMEWRDREASRKLVG